MSKIISIVNQKGGVAKTTSTFNIGYALSSSGYKVLLIDYDPQASLTISVGLEPLKIENTIVNALQLKDSEKFKPVDDCIVNISENLDIITSTIDLATLEMQMLGWTSRERCLVRALAPIKDKYDYILIDCAPQLSLLTLSALAASRYMLVPCKTDYLAYRGLENLMRTYRDVKELLNENLELAGVFPTLYNARIKDDKEVIELLEMTYGNYVWDTIKLLAAAKKGVADGISTVQHQPKSEIAIAYKNIANRLTKLEE